MSSAQRTRLLFLTIAGALAAGGCGGSSGDPQVRLDAWMTTVCDGTPVSAKVDESERLVLEPGDGTLARASCTIDDPEPQEGANPSMRIEGWLVGDDPRGEMMESMDGWESGDGTHLTFAVAELDDGTWGAIAAFTDADDAFDALDEEHEDIDWEFRASHSDR